LTTVDRRKLNEYLDEFGDDEGIDNFMRYKCRTDLYYLVSDILGWENATRGKGKKNTKLLDPRFHRWLAGKLEGDQDVLIMVPRGHLKSAFVKAKIIQEILKDPYVRIGFFSITQTFVEQQLATVKRFLRTPLLMRLFPDIIGDPDKWQKNTQNSLTMSRAERPDAPEGEQIRVWGVENAVTGNHTDINFYDDLVNKTTVRTVEMIEKTHEWYSGAQPILEPEGREVMIGTPYHYSDLYHSVMDDELFDHVYVRQIKESGKFIYRWFTEKRFNKATRKMTAYDIQSQYFCNPMPVEDMAFPPPQPTYDTLPDDEYSWYIAVDPAATTKTYSDETAIVVAAVTKGGMVYIEKAFHGKWPGNETAKRIIELTAGIEPRKVGIEFGLQEHLKYIIDNEKSAWEEVNGRKLPLFIEPIRIRAQRNKFDRVNWTLGSFVREGNVRIHKSCSDLISQMDRFTKNYTGRDDIVDAAAMIFQLVEHFSFRNYTKEETSWAPKAYFTFDDMAPAGGVSWENRFTH
jgi:hypothetical protein